MTERRPTKPGRAAQREHALISLQRQIGNQAVSSLIAQRQDGDDGDGSLSTGTGGGSPIVDGQIVHGAFEELVAQVMGFDDQNGNRVVVSNVSLGGGQLVALKLTAVH